MYTYDPKRSPGDLRATNGPDSTGASAMDHGCIVAAHYNKTFFGPQYVSH